MAGNPNLIGGGRLTRAETSGDKRRFEGKKLDMGALLLRLWRYIGRNRVLVILAVLLNVSSSLLALYGPKLSGRAINAIEPEPKLHPVTFIAPSRKVFVLSGQIKSGSTKDLKPKPEQVGQAP